MNSFVYSGITERMFVYLVYIAMTVWAPGAISGNYLEQPKKLSHQKNLFHAKQMFFLSQLLNPQKLNR